MAYGFFKQPGKVTLPNAAQQTDPLQKLPPAQLPKLQSQRSTGGPVLGGGGTSVSTPAADTNMGLGTQKVAPQGNYYQGGLLNKTSGGMQQNSTVLPTPGVQPPGDPYREEEDYDPSNPPVNQQEEPPGLTQKGPPTTPGAEGERKLGTDGQMYEWKGNAWVLVTATAPPAATTGPPTAPGTWNGETKVGPDGRTQYKWWIDRWLAPGERYAQGNGAGMQPPAGTPRPAQQPYNDPDRMALHQLLGDTNSAFHSMTKYDLEVLMPWIKNDPNWASLSDANARGLAQQQLGQLLNNPNANINQIRDYVARMGNIGSGQEYMQAAEQALGNPNSGFHQRATKAELFQMFPAFAQDMQAQGWTDAQARHVIGQYMGSVLRGNGDMATKRSILQFLQRFG